MASNWKFSLSLLDRQDFPQQLISVGHRELVGAVTGNRWREAHKDRIGSFTTEYNQRLALDEGSQGKSFPSSERGFPS